MVVGAVVAVVLWTVGSTVWDRHGTDFADLVRLDNGPVLTSPPVPDPSTLPVLPIPANDPAPVVSDSLDAIAPRPATVDDVMPRPVAESAPMVEPAPSAMVGVADATNEFASVTVATVVALQSQIDNLQAQIDSMASPVDFNALEIELRKQFTERPLPGTGGDNFKVTLTAEVKKQIENDVAWYYKNRPIPVELKREIENKVAWYVDDRIEKRFKVWFDKHFSRISEPMPSR